MEEVEKRMGLAAGTLSDRGNQTSWDFANKVVDEMLEDMLDEDPELLEKLPGRWPMWTPPLALSSATHASAPEPGAGDDAPAAKRRKKGEKVKGAKRARPAELLFHAERREAARAAHLGLKPAALAAELSKMWKGLPEGERRAFEERAEAGSRHLRQAPPRRTGKAAASPPGADDEGSPPAAKRGSGGHKK
eukprot:gene17721-21618_t